MGSTAFDLPMTRQFVSDGSLVHDSLEKLFSGTPDLHFRCFYPCEIIISHIYVPMHTRQNDPYVSSLSEKNMSKITTHVR